MKNSLTVLGIPLALGILAGAWLAGGRAYACSCVDNSDWQLSKSELQPDAPPEEERQWPAQGGLSAEGLSLWQPGTNLNVGYAP